MFNQASAVELAPVEVEQAGLIPLSHFELDHPRPGEGWSSFLGRRGMTLRPDDIGRDSIRRSDAQILLHEQRANELRAAKRRQVAEAEAVEADQRRRASIWKGLDATRLPPGSRASEALLAAARDAQPRRQSVLQHALSNEGALEFHPYAEMDES